jgi:hypothetical protein
VWCRLIYHNRSNCYEAISTTGMIEGLVSLCITSSETKQSSIHVMFADIKAEQTTNISKMCQRQLLVQAIQRCEKQARPRKIEPKAEATRSKKQQYKTYSVAKDLMKLFDLRT